MTYYVSDDEGESLRLMNREEMVQSYRQFSDEEPTSLADLYSAGERDAGDLCRRHRPHRPVHQLRPMFQVGFADDPGRWDHWPSTMVMCWPEFSDGQIVLAKGDILLPFKEYVRSPVTLHIADGRVNDILGGADARALATRPG